MIEINKVILIGRITKDLELRRTNSDLLYCKFTLAVNRRFKNKNGDYDVDFINCVAWKGVAENLVKYCRKGSRIAVEGSITTNVYEDQNGVRHYSTEVVVEQLMFLDNKLSNNSNSNDNYNINTNNNYNSYNNNDDNISPSDFGKEQPNKSISDNFDYDIPF